MTAASHKRVRVVSACDVTVPPPHDLATPCDAAVDDNSDGAGSATDDRGDDFPGAYGSGTDSVLDLAQPQAKPLGSTGASCLFLRAAVHTPSTQCPDAPTLHVYSQTHCAAYDPTRYCLALAMEHQRRREREASASKD